MQAATSLVTSFLDPCDPASASFLLRTPFPHALTLVTQAIAYYQEDCMEGMLKAHLQICGWQSDI